MAPPRRIDDEEFVKTVIDAIEKGASPEVALRAEGVSVSSWYEWKDKAKAGVDGFAEFLGLIDMAEARSELNDIFSTQAASQTAPKATIKCPECQAAIPWARFKGIESMQKVFSEAAKIAIERLSRRFPRRWAAVSRIQVEDEQREFLDRLERVLDPEVFRMVLEICASEDGGTTPREAAAGSELH